jgi:cell division protease FtsH
MPGYSEVAERARQRVDDEKRRIVREAHEDAVQLLSENRQRLDGLAEALFQAEMLDGPGAHVKARTRKSGRKPRPRLRLSPN